MDRAGLGDERLPRPQRRGLQAEQDADQQRRLRLGQRTLDGLCQAQAQREERRQQRIAVAAAADRGAGAAQVCQHTGRRVAAGERAQRTRERDGVAIGRREPVIGSDDVGLHAPASRLPVVPTIGAGLAHLDGEQPVSSAQVWLRHDDAM